MEILSPIFCLFTALLAASAFAQANDDPAITVCEAVVKREICGSISCRDEYYLYRRDRAKILGNNAIITYDTASAIPRPRPYICAFRYDGEGDVFVIDKPPYDFSDNYDGRPHFSAAQRKAIADKTGLHPIPSARTNLKQKSPTD